MIAQIIESHKCLIGSARFGGGFVLVLHYKVRPLLGVFGRPGLVGAETPYGDDAEGRLGPGVSAACCLSPEIRVAFSA